MAIRYKVGRATLGGQERTYPQLVPGKTISADEFQRKVAARAARGLADVAAVFIAAHQVLLEELRDEQSVKIPGLGQFTLTIQGKLDENQRLVPSSARLKVNFRPDPDLAESLGQDLSFEYVGQ